MRTLILMRHAKSSWATPGATDHDRPLNGRGKAAAPLMAKWLAGQRLLPDAVLCSPAKRTRQTVKLMRAAVPAIPAPRIVPGLYEAMPEDILAALRAAPPEAGRVLLVGHEPGISAAAARLSDGAAPPACRAAFAHFPTAAMVVFDLAVDQWGDLAWGRARATLFARPRDLLARPAAGP